MNAPVIDIGAFLDDPTAERVRDAFNKVNDANAYLFPLLNEGTKVSEIFRAFISGSGSLTAQATASINAGALFTLQANRLGIVSFIEWKGEPFNSDFIKSSFLLKSGARDYGVGSPAIIPDDLFELPTKEVSVSSDFLFDLGNIGTSTIEDYVNANGTYSINGLAVFEAIQDGDDKAWLFTGGNGNWGFGATPVTASMFVDLGSQDPIPSTPTFLLPVKKIEVTPYTITNDDLNRPLWFTSNNQVVNIPTTFLATNTNILLYDFEAYFSGTGIHTVNHPQSGVDTFSQGDYIKALRYDNAGDTLWTVQQWCLNQVGASTLQEVTENGAETTELVLLKGNAIIGTAASGEGELHIGNHVSTRSSDPVLNLRKIINDANGTGNAHGFSDSNIIERGGDMSYCSYDARFIVESGTNTHGHFVAFQDGLVLQDSGLVDRLYGFYSKHTINAGSSVTQRFGMFIGDYIGTGTVDENYGIWVDAHLKGTNFWALRTNGGLVEFKEPPGTGDKDNFLISRTSAVFGDRQFIRFKAGSARAAGIADLFVLSNRHDLQLYGSQSGNVNKGLTVKYDGSVWVGATVPDISTSEKLTVNGTTLIKDNTVVEGNVTAEKFFVSALNTAPASAVATGTTGEIRITSDYIYVCIATNTWVRSPLATW